MLIFITLKANNFLQLKRHCHAAVIAWFFIPILALAAMDEAQPDQPHPSVISTEAALSVNEPMYLVLGGSGDIKGRFQFSFKYRIFDEDSSIVRNTGWLGGVHFAYTQTSLWNLSADSLPFEDSSYRPSLFWDFYTRQKGWSPTFIRTGYEHESNGQAGDTSRSIDTFIFWPFWGGQWHGRDWLIAPKYYAYLAKGEFNEDIAEYRGYTDLWLRYGNEDDWLVSSILRHGDGGRHMIQLDLSYPTRKKILSRTGGYVYVQLFQGYGESLITYNEKQDTQIRVGFAIVR